jgi:hypothetical protein
MKQRYLSVILFVLVILCVAGAVYLKWEKSQQQEVTQQTPSTYIEPIGSYTNPIKSMSGVTYSETDEDSGISLELPVEFKPTMDFNSFALNTVYFDVTDQNVKDEVTYGYAIGFQFVRKDRIATDRDLYSYEDLVYPVLENLAVGESYTYSRFNNERKRDLFGENYENDRFTGDHVYTRQPDVNQWKVYQADYYELEPGSGYKATLETETHYLTISYGAQVSPLNPNKENILKLQWNTYLSILESARFN